MDSAWWSRSPFEFQTVWVLSLTIEELCAIFGSGEMIEMLFSCGHSKGLHFLEIASPLLSMFIRSFIPALYLLNVKPDLPNAWTLGSYGWNFGARILHRFGVVEPLTFWISNSLGLVLEVQRSTCNFVSGEMIENALFFYVVKGLYCREIFSVLLGESRTSYPLHDNGL